MHSFTHCVYLPDTQCEKHPARYWHCIYELVMIPSFEALQIKYGRWTEKIDPGKHKIANILPRKVLKVRMREGIFSMLTGSVMRNTFCVPHITRKLNKKPLQRPHFRNMFAAFFASLAFHYMLLQSINPVLSLGVHASEWVNCSHWLQSIHIPLGHSISLTAPSLALLFSSLSVLLSPPTLPSLSI